MKICHILTADPNNEIGGTPSAVRSLQNSIMSTKEIISDVKYGKGFGLIKTIIYPLLNSLFMIKNDYDIIHIHDSQGYWYTFVPKIFRKKIIYTSHGETTYYYEIMKPKGFFKEAKARIAIKIQKRLIEKADIVVAVSEYVKKCIIKYYKTDPKKIVVIYNGVDTDKFKPLKKNKSRNKVAIWVGTDPYLKGLKKAIRYVTRKNMKLIVVGIDQLDNLNNKNNIEVKGKISYEQMPEVYNMADTLLFFSKGEGHPLVPLEAMACGLNIVASKESHIEIIPIKGKNYFIDSKNARKIAKKYDWKKQTKKYIKLYKSITG